MTPWIVLGVLAIAAFIGYAKWSDAFYGYWPKVRQAPPGPDYRRIAELEYELGLSDRHPPSRKLGGEALNASTYRHYTVDPEIIREAGYEPIEVTQFGDSRPVYTRGMRLPPKPKRHDHEHPNGYCPGGLIR